MTLEEFEKSLAKGKGDDEVNSLASGPERHKSREKHHHYHHHNSDDRHRHKRSRHSKNSHEHESKRNRRASSSKDIDAGSKRVLDNAPVEWNSSGSALPKTRLPLKRDSWMEAPSNLEYDFSQHRSIRHPEAEIRDTDDGSITGDITHEPSNHTAGYTFGDAGAQRHMTTLEAVFRDAEESRRPIEDAALERFGDLKAFDDAREEQFELDRRETYEEGCIWKEKPSIELFSERKQDTDIKGINTHSPGDEQPPELRSLRLKETSHQEANVSVDQTTLNRLKAQMMKARLKGSPNASKLEAEFNKMMASFNKSLKPETVVLNAMETRLLAGGRRGEVIAVSTKKGRERKREEDDEAMSIEDMIKEERRTRNEAGGDGKRFAERIAKDGKFDNDLDYMDENASKPAKRVHRSEINLKNMAISDFEKINRILDNCPLCYREDVNIFPIAPVVSLALRVYLTLPTEPEISHGAASIVPLQHRANLLECDDDEWEEIRVRSGSMKESWWPLLKDPQNFMKCLTQMYHNQGRDVIFYENAAMPQRRKHASMEAVPLPKGSGDTAPAFFKEAILASDEEWTQHRKLIDTLSKADQGLGRLAFRRTLVKEMPYFHVWFHINGGLGHIVEDANRWPKGDLFAREILGGILDIEPHIIRKQGRWTNGIDRRVEPFRQKWKKFDWTEVLASD